MQALAVLELIDVLHDGLPGLGLIAELPLLHQFVLPRTEEALHRHVVVAIAFPTHTHDHPATREESRDSGSRLTSDLSHPVASLEEIEGSAVYSSKVALLVRLPP